MNKQPLTNEAGEVRELNERDFAQFKPAAEVLPLSLRQKLNLEPAETISALVEFEPDIFNALRARGADWQHQMNVMLRQWFQEHPLAHSN